MKQLNKSEAVQVLGISPRQFAVYIAEGLPKHKKGRTFYYIEEEILNFVSEFKRAKGSTEDIAAAKLRRESALADIAQMEAELLKGEVVKVSEITKKVQDEYTRVKAKLLALPSKLAGQIIGETNQAMIEKILDDEIRDALEELSQE